MTNRIDASTEELRRQTINRRAPSRNGHTKPPPTAKSSKFPKFNQFVVHHMHLLNGTETKAWIAIWKEERNGISSISHQELAHRCGVARTNAIKAVGRLIAKGLLRVTAKGNPKAGTANKYTTIAEPP